MKIRLTFIFCLLTLSLFAQPSSSGLHVYYDSFSEQITYFRNGNELKRPSVKEGENIYFHLKQFNDFSYTAEIIFEDKKITPGLGYFSLANGGASSGGIASNFGFEVPDINTVDSEPEVTPVYETATYESSSVIAYSEEAVDVEEEMEVEKLNGSQFYAQFKEYTQTTANQLASLEQNIERNLTVIKRINQSNTVRKVALTEVKNLKSNVRIAPDKIKELANEYITMAFGLEVTDEIKLDQMLERMDLSDEYEVAQRSLFNAIKEYDGLNMELYSFYYQMQTYNPDTEEYKDLLETVSNLNMNSDRNLTSIRNRIDSYPDVFTSSEVGLDVLINLKNEYNDLINSPFEYNFPPIAAKGDAMDFKIEIKEIESDEPVKYLEQSVSVGGGIKINAGVGLTFGRYSNERFQYELQDTTIVASKIDQFVPMIASFIHFYAMPVNNTTIGASFGIGIPISNGNNLQSASFFLGPSLIVGKSDRMIISGGLMGGKVQRLSQDFEIGDTYLSQGNEAPILDKYELGWFLGISYNITR